MYAWQATVQDEAGNIVPLPVVTVTVAETGALARIYDDAGVELPNPLTGSIEGFVQFWVGRGIYKIDGTKGWHSTKEWEWDTGGWSQPFPSRAAMIAAPIPATVRRVGFADAQGRSFWFARDVLSAAIPDFIGWVPDGSVTPQHFEDVGGGQDATAAIQRAADYLGSLNPARQGRPVLYFPGGEYLVTDTISFRYHYASIDGDGPGAVTIRREGDFGDTFHFSRPDPAAESLGKPAIRNVAMRTYTDTNSGAHIRLTRTLGCVLDNVAFDDQFGGILVEGGIGFYWNNISIHSGRNTIWSGQKNGSYFVRFVEGPASQQKTPNEIFVSNFNFRTTSGIDYPYVQFGIDTRSVDGLFLSNGHVLGCYFANLRANPQVTTLSPSGAQITGIMTSNVWFDNGSTYGIRIDGTSPTYGNFEFTGSQFLGNTENAVRVSTGCNARNIKFSGGLCTRSGKSGFLFEGGVNVSALGVSFVNCGSQKSGNDRAGIAWTAGVVGLNANGCEFTNTALGADGDNMLYGGYAMGANENVNFGDGNMFLGMTEDVRDQFNNTRKSYSGFTNAAFSGIPTDSGAVTLPDVGEYFILDTSTSAITGMVGRNGNRIVAVEIASTRTLTHSSAFALAGGADFSAKSGDVFTFAYRTGIGWREVSRSIA